LIAAVPVRVGFDGETLGALTDLAFTVANKGQSSTAGKLVSTAVSSAKSADTSAIWLVGLQYKIIDAATGGQIGNGYIEDKMEITTNMNSFMGATKQQGTSITLDTIAQRLIQKAVAEIDKKYKINDTTSSQVTATDDPIKNSHKKRIGENSKKTKAIIADYKKKLNEQAIQKDKDSAITLLRCHNNGIANLDQATVLATLSKDKYDNFHKKYDSLFKNASSPTWHNKLKIDMSKLSYDMIDYKNNSCKIKENGSYTLTTPTKVTTYSRDETVDLVKEDGQWKVASLSSTDDNLIKEEKISKKSNTSSASTE